MENQSKLILKGVAVDGNPFTKEIRSLDEVKSSGNYVVVCKNATVDNGLPQITGKKHSCFCCEAQLNVTCCYSEDEAQGNAAYGQTLTICDRETGSTNCYTRTIAPGKNNGNWSLWQMVATGNIELVSQNNDTGKAISNLTAEIYNETTRAITSEQELKVAIDETIKSNTIITDIHLSVTEHYINEAYGQLQAVTGKGYCGLIPVKPGEKYLYSGQATAYVVGVAGYDYKGKFINKIIYDGNNAIIKAGVCNDVQFCIPENIAYIACSTNNQSNYPLGLKKISTAIEYEQRIKYTEVAYNKMRGFNIATTSGNTVVDNDSEASDFIPVESGMKILYNGKAGESRGIACYDANKQYIGNYNNPQGALLDAHPRPANTIHFIANIAKDMAVIIPDGCSYIRASSNDYINNPLSVKVLGGSTQYGKKYVWFGDSLSQLGSMPHQVGAKMGVEVVDVSFAGAPLTYSTSAYQGTGFMELVNCIAENDYTIVETALTEQENSGVNIADKLINLNNLKSVDWMSVTNVVIMAGANDMSVSSTTLDKIRSGFSSALQKLITKYPHLSIYFVSSTWRSNGSNDTNGLTMKNIIDTIKSVCEDYNIPFLYFYKTCGINQYNQAYFLSSDGLHPTLHGESMISTKIANWLSSL